MADDKQKKDIAKLAEQAGVAHEDVQDAEDDTYVLTFVGPKGARAARP